MLDGSLSMGLGFNFGFSAQFAKKIKFYSKVPVKYSPYLTS